MNIVIKDIQGKETKMNSVLDQNGVQLSGNYLVVTVFGEKENTVKIQSLSDVSEVKVIKPMEEEKVIEAIVDAPVESIEEPKVEEVLVEPIIEEQPA